MIKSEGELVMDFFRKLCNIGFESCDSSEKGKRLIARTIDILVYQVWLEIFMQAYWWKKLAE